MEKRLLILSLAAAGLVLSGTSHANVTKPLEVVASVASTCTLDVMGVNFGTFSGPTLEANGEVRVNCNKNVPYSIGLGIGRNRDSAGRRNMISSTGNRLPYRLAHQGQEWGDNGGIDPIAGIRPVLGVGKGIVEKYTVEGLVWVPSTAPAPGSYSDTVMVTVAF